MLRTFPDPDLVFEALGNPVRRHVLRLVAQTPLSVSEIATSFDVSRPAISRHLAVLEQAGLLAHHSVGTRNLYFLDPAGFAATRAFLDEFWNNAEARLRMVAENLENRAGDG